MRNFRHPYGIKIVKGIKSKTGEYFKTYDMITEKIRSLTHPNHNKSQRAFFLKKMFRSRVKSRAKKKILKKSNFFENKISKKGYFFWKKMFRSRAESRAKKKSWKTAILLKKKIQKRGIFWKKMFWSRARKNI